eukprot:12931379-Prorocentrum_lima.AAC.1
MRKFNGDGEPTSNAGSSASVSSLQDGVACTLHLRADAAPAMQSKALAKAKKKCRVADLRT